jgi:hypothetical protein
MIVASPVSHNHYFVLATPLIMGLMLDGNPGGVYPSIGRCILLVAFGIATAIPLLPGLEWLGDLGLATFAALWIVALHTVARTERSRDRRGMTPLLVRRYDSCWKAGWVSRRLRIHGANKTNGTRYLVDREFVQRGKEQVRRVGELA